ncbi:MAG: hypothetical protein GY714_32685 [Desulfobacterales bacterium]|nr:hypothetical protein [Desulfobacterales bacterium]MCP4160072.1 hypothetical protein [Deltaproteobacteria bacterium]
MKRSYILVLFILIITSCSGTEDKNSNKNILIQIKENKLTVSDFRKALEISKTAYQHNFTQNKNSLASVQERLLKQLTEELLLKTYAKDKKIYISDVELKKEIDRIKAEYPDNAIFEQMLLENAVSFDAWKERLKVRILMEKVIKIVIHPKIKVTSADMSEFYKKYYKNDLKPDKKKMAKIRRENTNALLVQLLRKKKTEELYNKWIDEIKTVYKVKINYDLWKKITN